MCDQVRTLLELVVDFLLLLVFAALLRALRKNKESASFILVASRNLVRQISKKEWAQYYTQRSIAHELERYSSMPLAICSFNILGLFGLFRLMSDERSEP